MGPDLDMRTRLVAACQRNRGNKKSIVLGDSVNSWHWLMQILLGIKKVNGKLNENINKKDLLIADWRTMISVHQQVKKEKNAV